MNNRDKKLFLLGVGAQKAGTTWLHSQLSQNNNVDFGFRKEYHVFDALGSENNSNVRDRIIKRVLAKNDKNKLGINADKKSTDLKLLSFMDDTQNYFDYFDYLYLKNNEVELVGDITPSYSMLDSPVFEHIKVELEARGFVVKVIFLMRDPFERIWSMFRMSKRNNAYAEVASDEEGLKSRFQRPAMRRRTEYHRTIEELERVFSQENIYYDFYENLFTQESYAAISSFLSIDLVMPDFDHEVNVSPKKESISESLISEICNSYKETYTAIDKISNGKSREHWRGYDYLK